MKQTIIVIYLAVMAILVVGVMPNQCTDGTADNILKSITFYNSDSDSTDFRLLDIEYDTTTQDFFFIGYTFASSSKQVLSRMDSKGNLIWGKSINEGGVSHYSLEYSPTYETLYFTLTHNEDFVLMRANSTDGNYLESYKIDEYERLHTYLGCSLSNDESVLFCGVRNRTRNNHAVLKYDRSNSELRLAFYPYGYFHVSGILAISNNEVMYHYERLDNQTTHLMKAIYTDDSLIENYHQSMAIWNSYTDYAICQLDENRQTVWHAISIINLVYFQHNLTDMSLIGSKYASSQVLRAHLIAMDVINGIVCISYTDTLLIINATTQDMIQLYASPITHNSLMINGYINIINCSSSTGPYCTHGQIPTSFGYDNLRNIDIEPTYTFDKTNSFPLTDEVNLTQIVTLENPVIYAPTEDPYTIVIQSSQSYVLNLPNSFDHNLTVNPGQNLTIDLPCRFDDFSSALTCETSDDPSPPSWIEIDCANSQILIQETNEFGNDSYSFSVTSTYLHGQIVSTFNITLVVCDDTNCISCPNRQCTKCSTGYQLNDNTSSCVLIPTDCNFGYDWNNDILVCNSDPTSCPTGQQWHNTTSSCAQIPINCDPGYQLSENRSSCVKINSSDDCVFGPNYTSTSFTIIIQAVTCTGVCVCFILALIGCNSTQDAWVIIHFLQFVLILPLVAKSMNKKIKEFIISNAFVALSAYSLPSCTIKSIPIVKNLSFDQPDEYLKDLGFSSGSTLVNIVLLPMIFLILVFAHLIVCLLHSRTKNRETRFSSIVTKVSRFFTFSVYIRIFIEIYMLINLMLVSEIKYYVHIGGDDVFGHDKQGEDKTAKGNYVSLILSCIILIFTLSFLLLVFISWKLNKDKMIIDQCYQTRELYNGLLQIPKRYVNRQRGIETDEVQNSETTSGVPLRIKVARLYSFLFLVKRLIFILIVVLIPDSLFILKILLLLVLQSTFCIMNTSCIRWFDKIKDQMVEIFNEAVSLCLLNLLLKYNYLSEWNDATDNVFIGLILSHCCILLLVVIISGVMRIVKATSNNISIELESEECQLESLDGNEDINNENSEVQSINNNQSEKEAIEDINYYKRRENYCQNEIEEEKKQSNEIHN